MANKATKMKEESNAYIGEERAALLETFTEKDWDDLFGLNLDLNESYFVKGSKTKLDKFEAFFLMRCCYEKPLFARYFLSEYVAHTGSIIFDENDSNLSFAEKDLLFLYVHNNHIGTGNSEAWVFTAALNKITNRNRLGYRTIVLSERNIKLLSKSPELITISLGGSVENRDLSMGNTQQDQQNQTSQEAKEQSQGEEKTEKKKDKKSPQGGAV